MTVTRLKEIYQELDRAAAHAFVLGDPTGHFLEARSSIGCLIFDQDMDAWAKLHEARFTPPAESAA